MNNIQNNSLQLLAIVVALHIIISLIIMSPSGRYPVMVYSGMDTFWDLTDIVHSIVGQK